MIEATPVKKDLSMNCFKQSQPELRSPILVILCGLCLVLFTACSLESGKTNDFDTSNARRAKLDTNIGLQDLRDLAKPPSPTESGGASASIAKVKGLNLEPQTSLFSESLGDPDDRIDRLEDAVQDIRDDFDEMAPSISRLVATEKDIQDLLAQLRTLLENESEPQPLTGVETAETLQSIQPVQAQAPPPVASATARVPANTKGLRVADHAGKTRIVFETASMQNYTVSFDQAEQLLIVETLSPITQSDADVLKRKSKRVSAANMSDGDGGKRVLAITTQGIKRITPGVSIKPNKDNSNYRYFFDMITN